MKLKLVRANVLGLVGLFPVNRLVEVESTGVVAAVIVLLVMVPLLCDVGSTAVVVVVFLQWLIGLWL